MEKIAIYGKGGIGKSVVATNLSASYALSGKKVLHVGCDPKHDSAIRLLDGQNALRTVLDILADNEENVSTQQIVNKGRMGIECCEAGGPAPGQGCAGRGVAKTLEFLQDMEILSSERHDVVIFDVLGDVVCGGFAAPMRMGFAEKVFIVVSEEPMALFAANNICKAVHAYSSNGIILGGLIANLRNNASGKGFLKKFAERLNTKVLAFIPRDELIQEAERIRKTVVEHFPESKTAKVFKKLSEDVLIINTGQVELPTPVTDDEFFSFIKNGER